MSVETASIDGYAIHRANSLYVVEWGGLGSPEVRTVRQPRPRQHGAIDASSLYGPRVMPVRGWAGSTDGGGAAAAVAAFDSLKAALLVEASHVVLIRRHGRSGDERLVCRLASDISAETRSGGEVIEWGLELVAPDPRLYDATEATAQRTGAGSFTATVASGTIRTPPTLEVEGPTNTGALTLTNTTAAQSITLTAVQALTAGQVATIDTNARTVFHHGAYHPENVVPSSTDWWTLGLGANTITVSGAALQAGTVVRARWRPARI